MTILVGLEVFVHRYVADTADFLFQPTVLSAAAETTEDVCFWPHESTAIIGLDFSLVPSILL